ncbi:hypothetical protein K469DRAFT_471835, partial [Zopfia rhizophila CBS 207.26]
NLGWNIDYATAFVVSHLDPGTSPDAAETLRKIRVVAEGIHNDGLRTREIAYRTFNKLDETLFAGHLKDAVFLDVKNMGSYVSGATYNHGQGPNPRVHRISIVLNAENHQNAPPGRILASLIHHMIHAYFLVACGPQEQEEIAYGRLGHGMHFGKILYTIKKLSGSVGRPFPLTFSHPPRYSHRSPYLDYDEYGYRSHRARGKWYCSHCHTSIEPILQDEIDGWYNLVCGPLLELPECVQKPNVLIFKDNELVEAPRSTSSPSAESVEFLFDEKAILVPNEKIDPCPTLKKNFGKTRFLAIPEDVLKETLMALLEFLHTGTYSPDIGPMTAPGRKGPPVIKPVHNDSPPYLLTDIRMFKLSAALGCEEIKGVAMGRLKMQHVTHEDPISVLTEIYEGGEPDAGLRSWGRKFLSQVPYGDFFRYGTGNGDEPPNLTKLECDMGFKERFLDLLERSGALHIDVLKTKEWLHHMGY